MEDKNPIQVADRLFLVLETLAKQGPMSLMELSRMLDLHKSTVHRLLNSLIYLGYVKQQEETGHYGLTFKLCELSSQILNQMDILDFIRPYLKRLAAITGETVHFVQRDGVDAVYIYKEESRQNAVRMVSHVGSRIPLYCSGVGKAMAADMSDEEIQELWKSSAIRSLTPYTITNYEEFLAAISQIRCQGYALDNQENELSVRCIAIGLPNYRGQTKYAISISAPTARMEDTRIQELADILLRMKEEIKRQNK